MKARTAIIIGIILIVILGIGYGVYSYSTVKSNRLKVQKLAQKSRANMVYIPAGTYTMGPSNPDWRAGNTYPPHKVTLTGFYISKYNVSYGDYDIYTKSTGKPYVDALGKSLNVFDRAANYPADVLTWYQVNDYCQWLKKKTGLPYDLPTEAQWEYVARNLGKKNWPFATNNGKQELCKNFPCEKQFGNQKGNIGETLSPLPVGSIPCTPMGICGLSGEINIWVKDWYQWDYYKNSPVDNPQGPKTGTKKIVRGGGAGGSPEYNHNFGRAGIEPNKKWAGFRCVINTDTPPDKLGAYAVGKQP